MRRIILGTLLIFIPVLGLSKDFNIRKELNNEKNEKPNGIGLGLKISDSICQLLGPNK